MTEVRMKTVYSVRYNTNTKEMRHQQVLPKISRFTNSLLFLSLLFCMTLIFRQYVVDIPKLESEYASSHIDTCSVEENNRFDCWPEKSQATEQACVSRGCCWKSSLNRNSQPVCFFPLNYSGYNVTLVNVTTTGTEATLVRSTRSFFSSDVPIIKLRVDYQTEARLRIKFYDPSSARYEVPLDVPSGSRAVLNPLFNVTIQSAPFNIIVRRVSTGAIIFDTTNTSPLIFSDQFLQISTQLSTKFLYGFGEHRGTFLQDITTWKRLAFWNRDDVPKVDNNGYGTHPFFLNLEPSIDSHVGPSDAHGVFLLNSNAGEAALQPFGASVNGAVTYRMIGGILDFFIVLGPTPLDVASQYTDIVGRPYFPPFWSLGFHICKYGLLNETELKNMIKRNRDAEMPYDTQWSDIDYMTDRRDWTYDIQRYADLPNIVKDLHNNQQRFIIIADPAISSTQAPGTYPPFDQGVEMDIFVKNASGSILIGSVWPGSTAFPDFFNQYAYAYWYKQASSFHIQINFDGLWIDMNEPSNFVDGSTEGCTSSTLDNPPYIPATIETGSLVARTLCPSAKHTLSTHYNLHNMYGWSQAKVSRQVLDAILTNKRSPIISRSTFAGIGQYAGHWTGDNDSKFSDLYFSVPAILNFNLFGIPFIGADICGFHGVTTPELCTRWHQLAVFYPFMRNHADIFSPPQDPAFFPEPYKSYIREALQLRYRLLAVLYTSLYRAHIDGLPVVRPLFYMYQGTESIDKQFMWGDSLLVIPVLEENSVTVDGYIPNDKWYDFSSGASIINRGAFTTLSAPLNTINVLVRGGSILPLLPAAQRTNISRYQKFQLLVAPDDNGSAEGELFWDDGESADSISSSQYTSILFLLKNNTLSSYTIQMGYVPTQGIMMDQVVVYGVSGVPQAVTFNGRKVAFIYLGYSQVLQIITGDVDLIKPFTLIWN